MHPRPHTSTHQACFFCLFSWCHVPLCERLNRQDHTHKPTNAPTPTYKHAPGVFLLPLLVVPRPLVRATQQARSHTQTHKCTHTHIQARTRRVSSVSSRGATSPRVSNSKGGGMRPLSSIVIPSALQGEGCKFGRKYELQILEGRP